MGKRHSGKKTAVNMKSVKSIGSYAWTSERVLLYIIKSMIFLALFTPLILAQDFFFPFVGPKSLVFMGAIQLMAAAYVLLIIYYSEYRPKLNLLLAALLLYLGILVLTTLTGVSPLRSFWSNHERMTGLLMWLHLTAFFVVLSSVLRARQDWLLIFAVTVSVAAIVGAMSLLELSGLFGLPDARGGSTIGNTSFMGIYLLFNAFLAVYLFLKSQMALRYYSLAIFLIIISALVVSDAVASILSFVLGVALFLLLYLIFMTGKRHLKIFGIASISVSIIAASVLAFLLFQQGSIVRQTFIRIDTEARLTAWATSWRGIVDRPWLGWGPENLTIPFMKHFDPRLYLSEHGGEVWFDRAHNIILDTLMASGILGILAYVALFAAAFILLWKPFFKGKGDFWTAGIISAALVAYFIQNLTVFDTINSYMMWLLMLAFTASLPLEDVLNHMKKPRRKMNLLNIIAVFTIFSGIFYYFTVSPWLAGSYTVSSARAQNINELLHFYGRAVNSSPLGRDKIRLNLAEQFTAFLISGESGQADRNAVEKALRFLENELLVNTREYPHDFLVHIELARFYNNWAQIDASKAYRARKHIDRALELSPRNQINYWVLAENLVLLNKHDEALEAAREAVKLEPRFLHSQEMLMRVTALFGNAELSEEKLMQALKINPDWEGHLRQFLPPVQ